MTSKQQSVLRNCIKTSSAPISQHIASLLLNIALKLSQVSSHSMLASHTNSSGKQRSLFCLTGSFEAVWPSHGCFLCSEMTAVALYAVLLCTRLSAVSCMRQLKLGVSTVHLSNAHQHASLMDNNANPSSNSLCSACQQTWVVPIVLTLALHR